MPSIQSLGNLCLGVRDDFPQLAHPCSVISDQRSNVLSDKSWQHDER